MIDTPGFGEAVDNTECWAPILEYVEDRFDAYLEAETRVERVDIRDNRSEDDSVYKFSFVTSPIFQSARLSVFHRSDWPRPEATGRGGDEEDPQEGQHHPCHREGRLLHSQGGQHVQDKGEAASELCTVFTIRCIILSLLMLH